MTVASPNSLDSFSLAITDESSANAPCFVATVSFYCVFSAYSVASPPVVSLYEYSLIIWAILIGYFLFNDIPTPRTFLGVFLIIGAGIYIYMREKARDQMIVSDTPNR